MAPSLRAQRLKLTWVLAVPFLLLARPTSASLLGGLILALPGLALRGSAAGHIDKDRTLATAGPYGWLRHPLYAGSFLAGLGLSVAAGRWSFIVLYLVLFIWVYARTVRAEEAALTRKFGAAFLEYRSRVPALVPRRRTRCGWRFQGALFIRNREWEAPLGIATGFGLLWLKLLRMG
jgi:protein-S-isoprenylcysteine O-methyltransferase Ste14